MDGLALTSSIPSQPRHCFLMTRLGTPIPEEVVAIRNAVTVLCSEHKFKIIDATSQVTGRDFLLKILKQIASS